MSSALLDSLRRAVAATPDDPELRLHLAELLVDSGFGEEAVPHLATVLQQAPGSARARSLMGQALAGPTGGSGPTGPIGLPDPGHGSGPIDLPGSVGRSAPGAPDHLPPSPYQPPAYPPSPYQQFPYPSPGSPSPTSHPSPAPEGMPTNDGFDWLQAERDLGSTIGPMFVSIDGEELEQGAPPVEAWDVQRSDVRLDHVGGMLDVKHRLEAAFLAPMRNPELRRAYGKNLRGGLLLYGPPGCGKTFIAKAVAGELGARFISVTIADVLDMYIGNSERNLAELFALARRSAPCVLFLDELDALGQKRSQTRSSSMRQTVNQLLTELDGVASANDGVFVLAATNHPWDVDTALRRPGRLDRTILVLPPDEPARAAILAYHLRGRPVEGVDLHRLAKATDGYSGADLAHVTETAAETVMMEAARSGALRTIRHTDVEAAVREVRPSIGPWFETARNVAMFANENGTYDELLKYLKKRRMA